jgi:UrcA family protein
MKESKLVKSVVATVAVVAFSLPAIASADAGEELKGRAEKVAYSDLNVDKEAGAQTLYRRLQQASKRVCGVESLNIAGSLNAVAQAKRCYRETLDESVAKIDSAALTEIHEG